MIKNFYLTFNLFIHTIELDIDTQGRAQCTITRSQTYKSQEMHFQHLTSRYIYTREICKYLNVAGN